MIDFQKYNKPVDSEIIRKELNISNDDFVIGTVGRLNTIKNPLFALDVFCSIVQSIPNSKLLLIGEGELEDQIKEKASLMNVSDRLIMLKNRSDVPLLLHCFDAFLFPSLFEGFGIALLEAEAAGLKCYASSGIPNGLINPIQTTVIPLDEGSAKWAKAIIDNRDSKIKYDESLLLKFDMPNIISKLEKVYLGN